MTTQNFVTLPREVVDFLLGEKPLEGTWFGDKHEHGKGLYWWRANLRAALTEQVQPAQGEPLRDVVVRLMNEITGKGGWSEQRDEAYLLVGAYKQKIAELEAALLQSNAELVPLTDEGKLILFECLSRTRYWEERDYFLAGIDCAERAHNITKGQQ